MGGGRVLIWFSCGAASAIAAKKALEKYSQKFECLVLYTDPGAEHPDNMRFLKDVEKWLDKKIIILKNGKYKDIYDVFYKRRYLVGPSGAPCTGELKRTPRIEFSQADDIHIFGYTSDEKMRAARFGMQNPGVSYECPLIEHRINKSRCFDILRQNNIALPAMYLLGYRNNNCIGCVKGQAGYWNKIRRDFPEVFYKMSKTERDLNAAINKRYENGKRIRIFLDELPPNAGRYDAEPSISCGATCEIDFTAEEIIAPAPSQNA